jgi:serine carboxypeptidase-like clade I
MFFTCLVHGYLLGNPVTDPNFDDPSKIPFSHGMGLISDEIYDVRVDLFVTHGALGFLFC